MSKKNLLNESQVRQFMKLASLEPLTPGFVGGLTERTTDDLEEVRTGTNPSPNLQSSRRGHGRGTDGADRLEEEEDPAELEGDIAHDLGDDSLEGDEEALGDEEEISAEVEPEGALEDQMINVQDLMTAITAAIEDVTGQPVESSIEDSAIDAEELDAEAIDDLDVDPADSMEADVDMEMDDGPLEEGGDKKGDQSEELDYEKNESAKATDELVEAITKRVAARILKAALTKK